MCCSPLIPFFFNFVSDDCNAIRHAMGSIVVPLIAKLKRSAFLASKLVFPVFPPGHPNERAVIDFSKVVEMDQRFDRFVTK